MRMFSGVGARASLLGSIAAVMLAAPAWGAPAWLAPFDMSKTGRDATNPQVAVTPQGESVAVWESYDSGPGHYFIQAAVRPPGTAFGEPKDLTVAEQVASGPQVAVDAQGNAVAIWQYVVGADVVIQAAVRPAGGSFGQPKDISATGHSAGNAQVAMDPDGDAVVVWERSNGTNTIVQAAFRPPGGSFGETKDLSEIGQSAGLAQVAMDRLGDAVVVWERSNGTNTIIQAAFRPAGGSFGLPQDLSAAGGNAGFPRVALDDQGNAVAVWHRLNGANAIIQAGVRPAGASFVAPQDLSATGHDATFPRIALDGQGNAVAVWERSNGTNQIVQAAVRPAGGTFGDAKDVSALGRNSVDAHVGADAQGNAVAVWQTSTGVVQGAIRPRGGDFGPATDLSTPGKNATNAQLAVDPQGNAIAVFEQAGGGVSLAEAAAYDPAGPQLRELSVPATGTAGVPVSFSVAPLDVWSALDQTHWAFGDGAAAIGTAPTHTYATAGTFDVQLSSADGLGNTTSDSRAITIAPAASAAVPALSGLTLAPAAFRARSSGPSVAAVRKGTRVSYSLNVAATVRFTVRRSAAGRRVGGRCVKSTPKNRGRKACRRFVAVKGAFSRRRAAGPDRFGFAGRVNGRALRRGRYRLIATPTAGGQVGKAVRAGFRIVR
jgi:hypothetical protein